MDVSWKEGAKSSHFSSKSVSFASANFKFLTVTDLLSDDFFMKEALKEAHKALDANEVPIGAVIVSNQRVIARGHNLT